MKEFRLTRLLTFISNTSYRVKYFFKKVNILFYFLNYFFFVIFRVVVFLFEFLATRGIFFFFFKSTFVSVLRTFGFSASTQTWMEHWIYSKSQIIIILPNTWAGCFLEVFEKRLKFYSFIFNLLGATYPGIERFHHDLSVQKIFGLSFYKISQGSRYRHLTSDFFLLY